MYFLEDWSLNIPLISIFFVTFTIGTVSVIVYSYIKSYLESKKFNKFNINPFDVQIKPVNLDAGKTTVTFDDQLRLFEEENDVKAMFLVHGTTDGKNIDLGDAEKFVSELRNVDPNKPLAVFLNTPGGSVHATEVIVNAIQKHYGCVSIYVPFYACSGGSIISLSGDKLYLAKNAHLGPFDPQVFGGFSANNLLKALPEEGGFGFFTLIRNYCSAAVKRVKNITRTATIENNYTDDEFRNITDTFIDNVDFHDQPLFHKDLAPLLRDQLFPDMPPKYYDLYQAYVKNNPGRSSNPFGILSNYFR